MGNDRTSVRAVMTVCAMLWAASLSAVHQDSLPTQRIGGVDYLSLWDFSRLYNPSGNWKVDGSTLRIDGGNSLKLTLKSRDAVVNGLRVQLSAPATAVKGRVMIPRADAINGLAALWNLSADQPLTKRGRVVIDPGHGGSNTGTRGTRSGVYEKKLALDIAFRVERLLQRDGVDVVLTRRSDASVELDERAVFANNARADAFVSIHLNYAANAAANGIETYCLPSVGEPSDVRPSRRFDNGRAFAGNANDRANTALANAVHQAVVAGTGADDRGAREARFAVLRDTRIPAALVECGYMSNAAEERKLLSEDYRERVAEGIARGILNFLGSTRTRAVR